MSWVLTINGRRYLEGGQRVQLPLPDDERVYRHFHFDGNSSLNGATATLRGKGWIGSEDEVVDIRSCEHGQDTEKPLGHLVVVKENRSRRSFIDAIKDSDDLFQKYRSRVIIF